MNIKWECYVLQVDLTFQRLKKKKKKKTDPKHFAIFIYISCNTFTTFGRVIVRRDVA